MNDVIVEFIKTDIDRCKNQTAKEGSSELYNALIGKYDGIFPGFSKSIPKWAKVLHNGASDYLLELDAIKEKLELQLIIEQTKDPLYKFKMMCENDLESLKNAVDDPENAVMTESQKQILYSEITAKYHPYVPMLSEGLYDVQEEQGFYGEVSGKSLIFNLHQLYNKLMTYQKLDYPGLAVTLQNTPKTVVNINNTNNNENNNSVSVSFEDARKVVEGMSSLPEEDIEEIQGKIDELEKIVQSSDSKGKKWSRAKSIVKWVADKGVDVAIAFLPLLLKIK